MRNWLWCVSVALAAAGCAPGQPWNNVTAFNTENSGGWQVVGRSGQDGEILLRVVAERPREADLVARKVIDQQLDHSPVKVTVEVLDPKAQSGPPVARVVWERPSVPPASRPADTLGTSPADHQGSPGATVH